MKRSSSRLQQYDVRFVQGPLFTAHYHDRAV